jgi:hypothetical protein
MRDYKLGKLPAVFDRRTLKLSNYLDLPKLPPLPAEGSDWFKKVSAFNMAGNDDYGDCVMAGGPAHMKQVWTANAGRREVITPDKQVIAAYLKLTGGLDTGLNLLEMLKAWRTTGFFGSKIGAFVSINPKKAIQLQYTNWIFGGVLMGLMLPKSIEGQKIWEVPPGGPVGDGEPGSLGGHCVNMGVAIPYLYCVGTWGMKQPMALTFPTVYADEAYGMISLDWFTVAHKTPTGLAWKDLMSDLAAVTR